MKNILIIACLTFLSFTVKSQGIIITPDVVYSTNKYNPSIKLGLSAGVQAIANESSLSLGVFAQRYTNISDLFYSAELTSDVFFYKNLGLDLQASFVRGDFYNEDLTKGADILRKCNGKKIGQEPDTRSLDTRTKLFGSAGLVYKINNIRLSTVYAFKDYAPNNWTNNQRSPYSGSVKVGLGYVFRLANK